MTDTVDAPAADARPETCGANLGEAFATCAKCGVAWRVGASATPACGTMTFARMRAFLEAEIRVAEDSHSALASLARQGIGANPVPSLERAAQLAAVLRLVNRVARNPSIVDILRGKS